MDQGKGERSTRNSELPVPAPASINVKKMENNCENPFLQKKSYFRKERIFPVVFYFLYIDVPTS